MEERSVEYKSPEQLKQEDAQRQLTEAMKEMAKRDPKQYKKLLAQMNPDIVHFDDVPLQRKTLTRNQRRLLKKQGIL